MEEELVLVRKSKKKLPKSYVTRIDGDTYWFLLKLSGATGQSIPELIARIVAYAADHVRVVESMEVKE